MSHVSIAAGERKIHKERVKILRAILTGIENSAVMAGRIRG
jgi:hypothetical protein